MSQLLDFKQKTIDVVHKIERQELPSNKERTGVENLLSLLSNLNKNLGSIEVTLASPEIQKDLQEINQRHLKITELKNSLEEDEESSGLENEAIARKQIEMLKAAVHESKVKLSESLNFLIESLSD